MVAFVSGRYITVLPCTVGFITSLVLCFCSAKVSALQCGLLPLCQETLSVGDISYYEYSGVLMDAERRDKLRRALGPANKVTCCINGT